MQPFSLTLSILAGGALTKMEYTIGTDNKEIGDQISTF
ncbi:hypothetical protein RR46_03042 [Papilio xuthus]|uniref:Uncharacterized protein n=1 Tax=Papilio xuthus TaxID=66420 RepID=A0A194QCK4_PAPXU|nr:hypothetical protein RR46_03042 [Papilio xuthus]